MLQIWFNGTSLGVLGIGLTLCFISLERLGEVAWYKCYQRGLIKWPVEQTVGSPPMSYVWLYITAFVVSTFFTTIFVSRSVEMLGIDYASTSAFNEHSTWVKVWRMVTILWVEVFLLVHVSKHPRYKLRWSAAWYVFSMILAAVVIN